MVQLNSPEAHYTKGAKTAQQKDTTLLSTSSTEGYQSTEIP